MYVAARCAPGQSWTNPAELVMPILNIGLQNCTLQREKMDSEGEKALKNCSGLEAIREKLAQDDALKEKWKQSASLYRQPLSSSCSEGSSNRGAGSSIN